MIGVGVGNRYYLSEFGGLQTFIEQKQNQIE